ncbi:hypothetical protein [Rufibacter hautae]|uniref:hypothetical protein n=1 Tax=Rufibacter hautae TaxID=2595005 RepID=UPI001680E7D4|nr:hypothetical protein [Rufibacter hautae]
MKEGRKISRGSHPPTPFKGGRALFQCFPENEAKKAKREVQAPSMGKNTNNSGDNKQA